MGHLKAATVLIFSVLLSGSALAGWGEAERAKAAALGQSFVEPQPGSHEQTPGLSMAVSRNGEVVFAQGFGYALPTIPATEETIYQVGSLTKHFTAAAILQLIERETRLTSGAPLAFETPVAALLPGAAAWALPDGPKITVRHLLTMTSNLPNFTRTPPDSTDPWGTVLAPHLLEALTKEVRPLERPGSFGYSNTSYFLLAELIESGSLAGAPRTYRDQLRAMWAAAGLKDTGFQDDSAIGKRIAGPNYKRRPAFLYGDWLKGSADVSSNVLDMQAWNKALIEGRVLSKRMLAELWSESARVDPHTWYGMGWFVREKDGVTYYTHSGSLPGYTSFNLIARRNGQDLWSSVTILTNSYGVEGLDEAAETIALMAVAN